MNKPTFTYHLVYNNTYTNEEVIFSKRFAAHYILYVFLTRLF